MEYIPQSKDFCIDCHVNTILIGEYYMVHHHVWNKSGLDTFDGMLCISCLENRIGRSLTSNDFSDLPINTEPLLRSNLLTLRMSS